MITKDYKHTRLIRTHFSHSSESTCSYLLLHETTFLLHLYSSRSVPAAASTRVAIGFQADIADAIARNFASDEIAMRGLAMLVAKGGETPGTVVAKAMRKFISLVTAIAPIVVIVQ